MDTSLKAKYQSDLIVHFTSVPIGDPPPPRRNTHEEVVARRRERAQRYAAKHHVPPPPDGPPDPPAPTEVALQELPRAGEQDRAWMRKMTHELEIMERELDQVLADDYVPDQTPDAAPADPKQDGDAAHVEATMSEMLNTLEEVVELASGRCAREEELELRLAEALDREAVAVELLTLADATETAGLGGSDFAALIVRTQRQGSEPCGAARQVAVSLDADAESEDVSRSLRAVAKSLLQTSAGSDG
jgi:hypothetical protein